jgi:colicin import membrane protein
MKNPAFLFWSMMAFHGAVAQVAPVNAGSRSLTAADKAYVTAIINKIRANVAYDDPSHGSDNPRVIYRVLLLPTGEVMSVDRVFESGTPDFDMAVQKGIWRASPLPKRSDGQVEHAIVIEYSLQSLRQRLSR